MTAMDSDKVKKMRRGLSFLRQKIAVFVPERKEHAQPESTPLTALTPFNLLPDELVAEILVYASRYFTEDTTQHLGGDPEEASVKLIRQFPLMLLTVCRRWYQIASSTPMFWAVQRHRTCSSWRPLSERIWKPFLEHAGPSIPLAADIEVSWALSLGQDRVEDTKPLWSEAARWKYLRIREFGASVQGGCAVATLIVLQQSTGIDWNRVTLSIPYPQPDPSASNNLVFRNITHLELGCLPTPLNGTTQLFWTFLTLPKISQLRNLTHLTFTSIMFAQAHSDLLADYTSSRRREVYTFPSLVALQMDTMPSRAMTVLGMMDLPVLVSLGLSEIKLEDKFGRRPPHRSPMEPVSLDEAYPIHLPAVKRLLLYNLRDSHPKITHVNLIRSAPSLTHLVVSSRLKETKKLFALLNLRSGGGIEGENGYILCPHLEDLSIYDVKIKAEGLKSVIMSRRPILKRVRLGKGMMEMANSGSWLNSTPESTLDEQVRLEEAESFAPPFGLEMLRIHDSKL